MLTPDLLQEILIRAIRQHATPHTFAHELEAQRIAVTRSISADDPTGTEMVRMIVALCYQRRMDGDANHPILQAFGEWVIQMDSRVNDSWTSDFEPNTVERRALIVRLLGLDDEAANQLASAIPAFLQGNVVIAERHTPWYSQERKQQGMFYWPSVLSYLSSRGFPQTSVAAIDQATDQIMDHLTDPNASSIYGSRGLVVGYVQSGKTTNINVLIAKAIDSGYRLVVVLAGLTDVLRNQTQRRFDKEVVGKSLIETDVEEAEGNGYRFDKDWDDFIEHQPQPGHPSGRPIERMTTRKFDFSKGRGPAVFTDSWVTSESSARVVIIKKNSTRLRTLNKELKKITAQARASLPVLVIDDESDQASINTRDPNRKKNPQNGSASERTAVNDSVTTLLSLLPRAQYVGYTATPFANVFIDPDDPVDLFPKDFVCALSQPTGYMGVQDFHDLDNEFFPLEDVPESESKKAKYVRGFDPQDDGELETALRDAVDSFVVAGAIKLYRRATLGQKFRHHTMFYTDSTGRADHQAAKSKLEEVWFSSDFNDREGLLRLERLFERDFKRHSESRDDSLMFPPTFESLRDYVSQTVQLINSPINTFQRILVVNSDNNDMTPDFERDDVWKILVGGAKLSRGYTIEGLTTTVFRRSSQASATLLQMGRWFGFRQGYKDLVRLYISIGEKRGKRVFDLYSNFEAICRDEEAFRRELKRYSIVQPDGSRMTPRDIPPLVQCTHPQLMPDQPAKMWNAKLTSRNFGGRRIAFGSLSVAEDDLKFNAGLFAKLFQDHPLELLEFGRSVGDNPFLVSRVPHGRMQQLVASFRRPNETDDDRFFKSFLTEEGHEITDWLVALPQVSKRRTPDKWALTTSPAPFVVERSYRDGRFTTVGEDRHRQPCYQISGITDVEPNCPDGIRRLHQNSGLAIALLYPMLIRKTKDNPEPPQLPVTHPAMGLEFFLPHNRIPAARFEARRPNRADDLVVERF